MEHENHVEIHERVTRVETKVESIEDNVKLIVENHLPHITERLGSLDRKIAYAAGGIGMLELVILGLQAWQGFR